MLNMPDDTYLHALTGCRMPIFEYIYSRMVEEIKNMKDAPLFTIEGHRESDPGTRRMLPLQVALVMILHRQFTNCSQEQLGALFKIDQGTVSQYIKQLSPILSKCSTGSGLGI